MNDADAIAAGRSRDCFVVLHTGTGEVLEVCPVDNTVEEEIGALQQMDREVPTMGRYFSRGMFTQEALDKQREETMRLALRIAQIEWVERQPADVIVSLLEGRVALPSLLGFPFDAKWMVRTIFQTCRNEWTPDLGARLGRLRGVFGPPPDLLDVYLAEQAGDRETLWKVWPGNGRDVPWHVLRALLEAFGRLGETSAAYVEALLDVLGSNMPFGGWFPAVTALGRVGMAAGARAVATIRERVIDSEPQIIAVRERAIVRITTPANDWTPCTVCDNGYQLAMMRGQKRRRTCPECMGFAVVRR